LERVMVLVMEKGSSKSQREAREWLRVQKLLIFTANHNTARLSFDPNPTQSNLFP